MAEKQMNIDDTQEEYLDTLVKLAFQQREALEIQKLFDDFVERRKTVNTRF